MKHVTHPFYIKKSIYVSMRNKYLLRIYLLNMDYTNVSLMDIKPMMVSYEGGHHL
jgi:hypothetical protein